MGYATTSYSVHSLSNSKSRHHKACAWHPVMCCPRLNSASGPGALIPVKTYLKFMLELVYGCLLDFGWERGHVYFVNIYLYCSAPPRLPTCLDYVPIMNFYLHPGMRCQHHSEPVSWSILWWQTPRIGCAMHHQRLRQPWQAVVGELPSVLALQQQDCCILCSIVTLWRWKDVGWSGCPVLFFFLICSL